jgi:hypothetical protein
MSFWSAFLVGGKIIEGIFGLAALQGSTAHDHSYR